MENLEKERYLRQMKVAELGEEGQEKLKQSTFLLIGAGGLGSPAAQLLAASGAGRPHRYPALLRRRSPGG